MKCGLVSLVSRASYVYLSDKRSELVNPGRGGPVDPGADEAATAGGKEG